MAIDFLPAAQDEALAWGRLLDDDALERSESGLASDATFSANPLRGSANRRGSDICASECSNPGETGCSRQFSAFLRHGIATSSRE